MHFIPCRNPDRDSNPPAADRRQRLLRWHFDDCGRKLKSLSFLSLSLLSGYGAVSLDNNPNYGHTPSHHTPQLSSLPFKHEDTLSPPNNIGTRTHLHVSSRVCVGGWGGCHLTARLYISKPSFCHITAEPLLSVFFHLPPP